MQRQVKARLFGTQLVSPLLAVAVVFVLVIGGRLFCSCVACLSACPPVHRIDTNYECSRDNISKARQQRKQYKAFWSY
jgi:hypothetical protein